MSDAACVLASARTDAVLAFLGCRARRPTLATLTALIHAYVRRVPWESALRIARKAGAPGNDVTARRPAEFWDDAFTRGGGGTCFESNLAFYALLRALGFTATLTINNMQASIGCHTAIIVTVDGRRYLADVGIPLHRPLRLDPDRVTSSRGRFHTYIARPEGAGRFVIARTRHPQRYIFTLIDAPVSEAAYIAASDADYGAHGLFLDRVIINKVIDEAIWRFSSAAQPYRLEHFSVDGVRQELLIDPATVAGTLAHYFGMAPAIIAQALAATAPGSQP